MTDGEVHVGHWWVPGSRRRAPGRLVIAADGQRLEFDSQFAADHASPLPVILGYTSTGAAASVLDAMEVLRDGRLPNSRLPVRQHLSGRCVLMGGHTRSSNPLVYGAIAEFSRLEDWLDLRLDIDREGGDEEPGGTRITTKSFRFPPSLVGSVPGAKIEVRIRDHEDTTPNRFSVTQVPAVVVVFDQPVSLEDLRQNVLRPLAFLFSFAVDSRSEVTSLRVALTKNGALVDVRHAGDPPALELPRVASWLRVFSLPDFPGAFDDVLSAWFRLYRDLRAVLSAYMAGAFPESDDATARFTHLAQAAEAYHRTRFDRPIIPPDDFKVVLAAIKAAAAASGGKALVGKFGLTNNLTLPERITELVDRSVPSVQATVGSAGRFAQDVATYRNDVAHLLARRQFHRVNQVDVSQMTTNLVLVMQGQILEELGFPADDIERIMRAPGRLVGLHWAKTTLLASPERARRGPLSLDV